MKRGDVNIRVARQGDAADIANVHINSWREAYRDLLPQSYLDQLPLSLERRMNWWGKVITDSDNFVLQVAESKSGIVGFACFSSGRDEGMKAMAEVQAIYLLEKYKGQGIGFDLLSSGFKHMIARNFNQAYCWVLEGNPTIKFYERSGAKLSAMTKVDEIGGQKVRELAYVWSDLNVGDYHWEPLSVQEVVKTLGGLRAPWWIAGGWAIDLFVGKQTRKHEDIDVIVRREDQLKIQEHLNGWDLWAADPPGTLRPWREGESLGKGLQDIWGRKTSSDPWQIQIMLFDTEDDQWIFKRDESIRGHLSTVMRKSKDGVPILSPEVQLLYKSKSLRQKDRLDFANSVPIMNNEQKRWLKEALKKVYRNTHPWIESL